MTTELFVKPEVIGKRETEFIGCLAQWRLNPEWLEAYSDVASIKESIGLKPALRQVSRKQFICNCAERVIKEAKTTTTSYRGDYVIDDAKEYIYVIVKHAKRKDLKDIDLSSDTKITWNKESNTVNVEGLLKDRFDIWFPVYDGKYTTDQLRLYVRDCLIEAGGVMFHEGVYIIPNVLSNMEKLAKVNSFILELGAGLEYEASGKAAQIGIITFAIPKGVQETVFVKDCFLKDIQSRVDKITESVGKVTKRKSALKDKEEEVEELNKVIESYNMVVGEAEMMRRVAEQVATLKKLIEEKAAELS